MNEMMQLIVGLFEQNNYLVISHLQSDNSFILKHKAFNDYWIVVDGLFDYTNQDDLYEKFHEKFGKEFPLAEKNTSLLLLVDTNKQQGEYDEVEIENDPHFFKKYVLPYTEYNLHLLKDKIDNSKEGSLEGLIMKDDTFEDVRRGEGYAALLYTIVHKLPFIPIHVERQQVEQQTFAFKTSEIANLFDSLDNLPVDVNNEEANNFVSSYLEANNNEEH